MSKMRIGVQSNLLKPAVAHPVSLLCILVDEPDSPSAFVVPTRTSSLSFMFVLNQIRKLNYREKNPNFFYQKVENTTIHLLNSSSQAYMLRV